MGASLLIFKNKSDIKGCMSETDVVEVRPNLLAAYIVDTLLTMIKALGLNKIQTHQWKILTCSAITGLNLQEGIRWVVQDAKDRLFLY